MREKGRGTKVSKREITAYKQLRSAGVSPQTAAELIGRSKSWAYGYEERQRIERVPRAGESYRVGDSKPNRNLMEACGLIMCVLDGDKETFDSMMEEYGLEIVPYVAKVAIYLAVLRARDLQAEYGDQLLEGEVIEAMDVFETVSIVMDRYYNRENLNEGEKVPELDHGRYREWLREGEAGAYGPWQMRDLEEAKRAIGPNGRN